MMGTHEEIDESENVSLVLFMEEENIRRAKDRHFTGLFTTNTNPLTQVSKTLQTKNSELTYKLPLILWLNIEI